MNQKVELKEILPTLGVTQRLFKVLYKLGLHPHFIDNHLRYVRLFGERMKRGGVV